MRSTKLPSSFMSMLIVRFYKEINQDSKVKAEAIEDHFSEEDFCKNQIEEAK